MKTRHRSIPDRAEVVRAFAARTADREISVHLFSGYASHGYKTNGEAVATAWLQFTLRRDGRPRPQRWSCRYTGRNLDTAERDYATNLRDARRVGQVVWEVPA